VGKFSRLLAATTRAGIENIIFSSTAAVYGAPEQQFVTEDTPLVPINPYGASKAMAERVLADAAAAHGLRYVTLRYFNVAGADAALRSGLMSENATHLVKVAAEVAAGKRPHLQIFGTDYPTPDGTAVRDYIHVSDLADAHVLALEHLLQGGESLTLNCGYGHGASVRDVVMAVEAVTGQTLAVQEAPRRAGDPPMLVADSRALRERLGWQPRFDDLQRIVESALAWEKTLEKKDG
jgi:UDP-glucose 4-epimerase